jgi:hypothetical protein
VVKWLCSHHQVLQRLYGRQKPVPIKSQRPLAGPKKPRTSDRRVPHATSRHHIRAQVFAPSGDEFERWGRRHALAEDAVHLAGHAGSVGESAVDPSSALQTAFDVKPALQRGEGLDRTSMRLPDRSPTTRAHVGAFGE